MWKHFISSVYIYNVMQRKSYALEAYSHVLDTILEEGLKCAFFMEPEAV